MMICDETSCTNLQSAICLHCTRYLCTLHIVEHGTRLLQEADELCQQINQVVEHLNNALEQIQIKRNEAVAALDTWRQKEIDKIEDRYAEKIQEIESKQDYLTNLENNLLERLIKNAKDPLEQMQTQKTANRQMIQTINQTLTELQQASRKLEWNSMESLDQNTSVAIEKMSINTSEQDYHQNNSLRQSNSGSCNFIPLVRPQSGYNQTITSISYYSQPMPSSTTSSYQVSFPISPFISLPRKPIDFKHLPTNSSPKFIDFFLNVSDNHDHFLDQFLINNFSRTVYFSNLMIILLSFLEAWHSKTTPTVFNERVLSYHIFTIKKYIFDQDSERIILAAILVYIHSCHYDETRSGQLMLNLLHHFFDQKCLSKNTILDWYENGDQYNYPTFQQGKQWATSFIDYLNNTD